MSQKNQVSFKLNEQDKEAINGAIKILKEKLTPNLKNLLPNERHELLKMGDKTTEFVRKTVEHCSENPELVPSYLDLEELKIDVNAVESLRIIYQPLLQLVESLRDTMMLSGSEAFGASLIFYNAVKNAMNNNVHNASTIYDDLSQRFPRGVKRIINQ